MAYTVWPVFLTSFLRDVGKKDRIKSLNPILTGLFESKFLLGGGGGGGNVNLTPTSDLGPEGADRREILHGCQDTCKEYCYNLFSAENCLFIMLLWFMQIRCIIT